MPPTKSLSLLFWRWAVLSIFFHIQLVYEFCNEWKFCQGWNLNQGRGDPCHNVPHKPACLQLTPKATRQVAKFALWYNLSPSTFISKIQKRCSESTRKDDERKEKMYFWKFQRELVRNFIPFVLKDLSFERSRNFSYSFFILIFPFLGSSI